jgi:hypothetical protein
MKGDVILELVSRCKRLMDIHYNVNPSKSAKEATSEVGNHYSGNNKKLKPARV